MQHTDTVVQENQDVCLLGLETSKTKEACTKGSYTVLQLRIRYLEKVCIQLLRPQRLREKVDTLLFQSVRGASESALIKSARICTSLLGRRGNCDAIKSMKCKKFVSNAYVPCPSSQSHNSCTLHFRPDF